MNAKLLPACVAVAAMLLAAAPVVAHHSFAAEFDGSKRITLVGVVTKVEWMNPHTFFYLDVKDDGGKVTNWALETGSPNALSRRGWTRHSLKEGDQVTVQAFRAKDGATMGSAGLVTLADGRKVFAGSNDDGSPQADNTSKAPQK